MSKLRIVMTGPLPPAIGGMVTVINDISQSCLTKHIELVLVNTAKTTAKNRSIATAIFTRLKLLLRCAKLIREKDKSILHIHTCSGFTFFLDGSILLVGKLLRVPVVLHIHGGRFDKFLDGLAGIYLFLARWLSSRASRVVVLSESWQKTLETRLPGARMLIIENGVPVTKRRVKTRQDDSKVQLLFLGNLSEEKGVWDLLHAVEGIEMDIRLIFAGGEGEPGIGSKLQQRANQSPLKEKYKWVGPVYADEKQSLLCESDIFVLPSYTEGLPISLLEAMCAGLPVIVTPVGGIPSVVTDDKDGILVAPGDVDALKKAIIRLVTDQQLRKKMGESSYLRCSNTYDIETVASRYLQLYEELVR